MRAASGLKRQPASPAPGASSSTSGTGRPPSTSQRLRRRWPPASPPDTISTDLQARHRAQAPPRTLPHVMAKLRAAGMPEADVFAAVTARPARVLGLAGEAGTAISEAN